VIQTKITAINMPTIDIELESNVEKQQFQGTVQRRLGTELWFDQDEGIVYILSAGVLIRVIYPKPEAKPV